MLCYVDQHPIAHPCHICIDSAKSGGKQGGGSSEGSGGLGSETKCCEGGKPTLPGPATGSSVQGETVALLGPITPKAESHYRSETTELYPCYRIRDIYSKTND